jgi:uncharacterized membrane protein
MTGAAISLVLLSALLHAVWNFFSKDSNDRWAFFFGQGLTTLVAYTPLVIWQWPREGIDATGWLWVGGSAITHAGYAFYLLKAYDAGDLSVAYPLSRTAPVLVALWDMATLNSQMTVAGFCGAILAGIGALTLQLPAVWTHGPQAVLRQRVTRYALVTAVCIAIFTIFDKHGVGHVPPFVFLYLISLGEFTLIGLRLGRGLVSRVAGELRADPGRLLFTGIGGPFSYLLILWVLTTAPASYVLGLRQTSIVFGVLLAHFFLRERETRYRLVGALIIASGSVLIAVAG